MGLFLRASALRQRSFSSIVPISNFPREKVFPLDFGALRRTLDTSKATLGASSLTYAEKLLMSHFANPNTQEFVRGESYLKLWPERVAMQDASAQMAMLQFMSTGLPASAVPATVHCDHYTKAHSGETQDLSSSNADNAEVYQFLESACERLGVGFWKPGAGIIHQIVLENYAVPGTMMIGCDSHTPNAGGLGMLAVGVGGLDAAEVMAGLPFEIKAPRVIGVHLQGELRPWVSPKDVILHLAGRLTVKGGTGSIVEYFGSGADNMSCTGMATMCNMGAEIGATSSVFPFTSSMSDYLKATSREAIAEACEHHADMLRADSNAVYDEIIELDLSSLEPHLNGPFTPDLATPLSDMRSKASEREWPLQLDVGLIGSCTNSSYEDMSRAAEVARQALDKGLKFKSSFTVTPGSEQIRATLERDGILQTFEEAGAMVLANACGPCIGQWDRDDTKEGKNSIATSFNRNFSGRNDGNKDTHMFLGSPEVVTALALKGRLDFNPVTDSLQSADGEEFLLQPPKGQPLPAGGFIEGRSEFLDHLMVQYGCEDVEVSVSKDSDRIQLLQPFDKWDGQDLVDMPVLLKVDGKCTTDHISPAGPWLKYKGHLENISECTLIGAVNADGGKINSTTSLLSGNTDTIPAIAREYKSQNVPWCVVADHNYGEGSAREHAALQPRFLGGRMILARSFARIHETNLKKQGMLPLTFVDENDYERVPCQARLSIHDLAGQLERGGEVTVTIRSEDGGEELTVQACHSMSTEQLQWFKAGSALNLAMTMS